MQNLYGRDFRHQRVECLHFPVQISWLLNISGHFADLTTFTDTKLTVLIYFYKQLQSAPSIQITDFFNI